MPNLRPPAVFTTPPAWLIFPRHQLAIRSVLVALTICPAVLLTLLNLHGPGFTSDSVNYASAARNFARSNNLNTYDGLPMVAFPPGMPLLLGFLMKAGVSLAHAATALNTVAFAILVVASFALMYTLFGVPWVALGATAALTMNSPMFLVYTRLWTEPIFVAVIAVLLAVLVSNIKKRTFSLGSLMVVLLCVYVACAWRYTGVTLLPIIAIGYYLATSHDGRGRAAMRSAGVMCAGSIVTVLVVARNLVLGSGPFGPTLHSTMTVVQSGSQTIRMFGTEMLTGGITPPNMYVTLTKSMIPDVIGGAIVVLVLVGAVRALLRRDRAVLLMSFFALVYWAMIVRAQTTNTLFFMNFRMIVATTPVLVLLAVYALLPSKRYRWFRYASLLGSIGLVVLLVSSSLWLSQAAAQVPSAGNTGAALSQLDQAALRLPDYAGVVTTDAQSLYLATEHQPVLEVPVVNFFCPVGCTAAAMKTLVSEIAGGTASYAIFPTASVDLDRKLLEQHGVRFVAVRIAKSYALFRVSVAPALPRTSR
jgi:hypothetical protein